MAVNQKPLFDALYCEEEEEEEEESDDDQELLHSLVSRERETCVSETGLVSLSRKEAVEWILRVNSHHGFSALTAVLAVNYLDRFLLNFKKDKRWMLQLVAVASLSLAAKVEETSVPLLLDLQVEDAEYLFEAKTIQRMELLILSSLKWRMNAVTPLSFLHHIVRRLRLKNYNHWEFLRSSENLILSVIADSRFVRYLPSVLAAATMLHIINQVEPSNAIEYENQILGALKINKEEVDECCEQLSDVTLEGEKNGKHKNWEIGDSSSGAIMSSSDASNDSWEIGGASSPQHHPILKKRRVGEQHMKLQSSSQHS
ncbi:hypothetical protein ACS0TY_001843 [Phlomoides rotata]